MVKRDEAWLRAWLRAGWDDVERGPLGWIEPGVGGTVGLPDCLLPVGQTWMPVELKASNSPHERYIFGARAAQLRFHRLAAARGLRTIMLVACTNDIIAFPFSDRLRRNAKVSGMSVLSVDHLVRALQSPRFWTDWPKFAL